MITIENLFKTLNKISFVFVALFISMHILNHMIVLISVEEHIWFMEKFRVVYRNIYIEIFLLGIIFFHIVKIIKNIWITRKEKKIFFQKIILIAKLYLIYFLTNHIGAVILGRVIFNLDTNIYYAVAGLHVFPFSLYFIVYYFLSILCLFIYLSRSKPLNYFYKINTFALVLSIILLVAFLNIEVPVKYFEMYKFSSFIENV